MSPMNKKLYPDNWKQISNQIRFERAGGRCERCNKGPHLETIKVGNGGVWYDEPSGKWYDRTGQETEAPPKRQHRFLKVILTTAHIGAPKPDGAPGDKRDKMDVRPENLLALCQFCHLLEDQDEHRARARNRAHGRVKGVKAFDQLAALADQVAEAEGPPAPPGPEENFLTVA